MPDLASTLEREMQRIRPPGYSISDVARRRDRRRRNKRAGTAIFALVLAATAIGGLIRAFQEARSEVPASTTPTGTIVFSRQDPGEEIDFLFTIDAAGTRPTQPLHQDTDLFSVSPDGRRILFMEFNDSSQWVKPGVVGLDGSGRRVIPIADPTMAGLAPWGWSPDGSRFVAEGIGADDPSAVGVYTARSSDGSDLVQLTVAPPGGKDRPVGGYSPNGSKILFFRPVNPVRGGAEADVQNVFVVNTDGAGLLRLNPRGTTTGGRSVSWSPDGQRIAFVASSGRFGEAPQALFVVDADGTDAVRITPWGDISPRDIYGAEWSPNGRWIAFSQARRTGQDLFVVRPDGNGLTQVTTNSDGRSSFGAVWSPDGRRLLFASTPDGDPFHSNLWTVNVDGTGLTQLTHTQAEYYSYAWTPSEARS